MKIKIERTTLPVYREHEEGIEIDVDPRIWIDYKQALKALRKIQNKFDKKRTPQMSYKEYSAWCHECSRPFIYYFTGMDEPDYECPHCNSNKYVTVP